MNSKLYVILPSIAFVLILLNAFFGHLIYGSPYDQDINKYSIYVHFQPEWDSYPGNILYDVTTVWSNPNPTTNTKGFYIGSSDADTLLSEHNFNQLEYQHEKPFVQLNHEFSNCESSWKPILYRYAIDSVRNSIQLIQGTQLSNDPYASIFPNVKNDNYNNEQQEKLISTGYAQFIPICTAKESTSYQYAVSLNNKKTAFDVYFVPSVDELENYLNGNPVSFYMQDNCVAKNYHSFTGFCKNVDKNSGLLVIIPDDLNQSLTKISVSLHEQE